MNISRLTSSISILLLFACVDQLQYPIGSPENLPISVDGHITNRPGPYQITINKSFDIQSAKDLRIPVSAQHVNLIDELGYNEELVELRAGIYQTSLTGIKGRIGGVYTLRIEFFDGKIYESIPDTLLPPGKIDSLYHSFNLDHDLEGNERYGFDLMVNAHENFRSGGYYMWKMVGTFKSITMPELMNTGKSQCYPIDDVSQKCNFLPLCTGLRNTQPRYIIPVYPVHFKRIAPCDCCTCWYHIFNNAPVLSDDLFNASGNYRGVSIYRVPLNEWIFMFKIHVQVSQLTLTKNAFDFFKRIQDQKLAIGSLFQPITGKIPNTFIQVAGTPAPIVGIFYAAGVSTKIKYITPAEVPYPVPVPKVNFSEPGIGAISCLELFPNATNIKPDFWED